MWWGRCIISRREFHEMAVAGVADVFGGGWGGLGFGTK